MAEPTPRTTSNPYAPMTVAQIQEEIAVVWWGAASFSGGLSSERQAQINRLLDDGVDRVDAEGFAHQTWCRRYGTVAMVADEGTFLAPADCKRIITVGEIVSGKTRNYAYVPRGAYESSWGSSLVQQHPFVSPDGNVVSDRTNTQPIWTHWAKDSSDPPRIIIKVDPAPTTAAGNYFLFYRPHFGQLSVDSYVEVHTSAYRALKHYLKMVLAADTGSEKQFALQERLYDREMRVLQRHEDTDDDQPITQQLPGDFTEEIGTP